MKKMNEDILEHLPLKSLKVFAEICHDAGIDLEKVKRKCGQKNLKE